MIPFGRARRRRAILAALPADQEVWRVLMERGCLFGGLTSDERLRLRQLVELFLHEKNLDPVGGLVMDAGKRLLLASQACLPILQLGLDACDNWSTLIVYPGKFIPDAPEMDPVGVVHPPEPRIGESWPDGPIIVSWRDVKRDFLGEWDYPMNVVIHEVCHQLDVRNGAFDGMPPLPEGMDPRGWVKDFSMAYSHLQRVCEGGRETHLDPYAAESPAEFFAVACETFFVAPEVLVGVYPRVYHHLSRYFRQDPFARMGQGRS
ncbi:MAG: zinc-dependent peptidase [Magnetococcales bacterium]|nr:zinc-dependent peptidase [Magnetococcales bacterium]